jgi:hypothetical protein
MSITSWILFVDFYCFKRSQIWERFETSDNVFNEC